MVAVRLQVLQPVSGVVSHVPGDAASQLIVSANPFQRAGAGKDQAMPRFLSRATVAGVALSQAKKFLDSPRGKQLVAQAKAKASDPATRAKVNEVVGKVRRMGQA